jgi:hypothetical protein
MSLLHGRVDECNCAQDLKNTHTHLRAAIIHRRKGLTSNEIKRARSLARVQTNSTYDYLFVECDCSRRDAADGAHCSEMGADRRQRWVL